MALNTLVGSVACPASGDSVISLASGFDPKVIIAWTVGRSATGGGSGGTGGGRISKGVATYRGGSVSEYYVGIATEDAAATSDVYVSSGNGALVKLTNGTTNTVALACSLASMASGVSSAVTLSYATRTTGILVNYVILGGSDVEDALVGTFNAITTPTTQDVTVTSGFGQPSLLFFLNSWDGPGDNTVTNGHGDVDFGFGVKSASANGRGVFFGDQSAAGTQATSQQINNNRAQYVGSQGAVLDEVAFQLSAQSGWPTDGFEVTYGSGQQDFTSLIPYLAIKLSSSVTVTHGEGAAPITGGLPVVQTLASAGTPKLLFLLNCRTATANTRDTTSTDAAYVGIGAVDGAGNERYAAIYDDDAQATAAVAGTAQSDAKAIQFYLPSSDTLTSEADGLISGSDYQLSWNDIDATAFLYEWVAIGVTSSVDATVTAPPIAGVGDVVGPTASADANVAGQPLSGVGDVVSPSVTGGGGGEVIAPPASGAGDLVNAQVSADSEIVSSPVVGSGDVVDPSVAGGSAITAGPLDGSADVPTPSVSAGATVTAPPADATGELPPINEIISAVVGVGAMINTGGIVAPSVSTSAAGTVTAPAADGSGDVVTPSISASAAVDAGLADGAGDLVDPSIGAGASVASPALDGVGDIADPTTSGTSAGTVIAPAVDASGDLIDPVASASANVGAKPASALGDLLSPVLTASGKILPRIDLPTDVLIDHRQTTIAIDHSEADVTIMASTTTIDLREEASAVLING